MNTNLQLVDSSLQIKINNNIVQPGKDFKLISVEISEGIFRVPTFSVVYSTPVNTENMDLSDVSLSIDIHTSDGGVFKVSYTATVLILYPNKVTGVLIPRDSYCVRRSQSFGNNSLDSIIKTLRLTSTDTYELNSGVQGNNVFYQLNETNWQCGSRLLNLAGRDLLWAVTEDKVKLFSSQITDIKSVDLTNFTGFEANSSRLIKSLPDSINSNSNFYYGTYNCCIPSVSEYPKVSADSLVAKKKYSDWRNVTLSKTTLMRYPNLSIGDCVRFDWKSNTFTDFILTDLSYKLSQTGNTFNYTFANYSKWDPSRR